MKDTLGRQNPFRYKSYYFDREVNLYYLQSRFYDPETGRFLNADDEDVLGLDDDLYDKNLFAYCDNNPVVRIDYSGKIWDFIDIGFAVWSWCDFISKPSWGNLGWALLDTVGLLPLIPSAGYITRTAKVVNKASKMTKVSSGFGKLSKAGKYGIKSYNSLKKVLKGTFLQAHHVVERRLAKRLGIRTGNMLSVAVTASEHQKFTNAWRKVMPYGSNYWNYSRNQIWGYAKQIYKKYPDLLMAAKKTILR